MTKRKSLLIVLIAMLICSVTILATTNAVFADTMESGKAFVTQSGMVKYKTAQYDPDDESAGKGLLLYSYDSGSVANFSLKQSGAFSAKLKPVKNLFGNKNLSTFSLIFTDVPTGGSFKVVVSDGSICVEYNGQKAGICYYYDGWSSSKPSPITAELNAQGTFTEIVRNSVVEIQFDPQTLTVSSKLTDGSIHTVWSFSSEYNSGKQLINDLQPFTFYDVSVCFDSVSPNGRGDLLVYSFGGYSFANKTLARAPSINVVFPVKAVVGKQFTLPTADVYDPIDGKLSSDDVTVEVCDKDGNVVNNGYTFTPNSAQDYYVCYTYSKDDVTQKAFYVLTSINESDIQSTFFYDENLQEGATVGVGAKVYIPVATVESSIASTSRIATKVTVSKDGNILPDYQNVNGGFYLPVTAGAYFVKYSAQNLGYDVCEQINFTATNEQIAVNVDVDDVYDFGTQLQLPKAEIFVNGVSVENVCTIVFPSGKTSSDATVLLDEEGAYTFEFVYSVDGAQQSVDHNVLVKRTYASLFDGGSYERMNTNNEVSGVKVSLTNNKVVTFNKIIDFTKYSFDSTLSDLSQNVPFIQIYAQPQNPGSSDLDSLFVTITDAHDSSNYITVRLKLISYFQDGTLIRTKASNQITYVGYNYEFTTTELAVHAAAGHEDGGFQSYFSFTHNLTAQSMEEIGLPLYFDYKSAQLYSRPAWLTGHRTEDGSADYSDLMVPWLVYDYDATDSGLRAGNKAWQGFSTGEVYISLYGKGISTSADFFITGIDGCDLSERYVEDNGKPQISVDIPNGGAPTAKVNKEYKIFDFTATDTETTVVKTNVAVTYNNKVITITEKDGNKYFTPTVSGKTPYIITYTAVDAFGNETQQTVEVYAKNKLDVITLQVDAIPDCVYGQVVTLPTPTYSGGSGALSLSVKVLSDGKEVPIEYGTVATSGNGTTYKVIYTVTDYAGQEATKEVTFNATVENKPIFDPNTVVLPSAFIVGDTFAFGKYTAVYYDEAHNATSVNATISVVDGSGTHTIGADGKYVPAVSQDVTNATITLTFDYNDKQTVCTYVVPIQSPKVGDNKYLTNFFATQNATIDATKTGIEFAPLSDEMSFAFVRAIHSRQLTLKLLVSEEQLGNGSFTITLADTIDVNTVQKLTFTYDNGYRMSVNGATPVKVSADNKGYLCVGYSATDKTITDGVSNVVAKLSTTANGRPFDGFTSGSVYFSVEANGVSKIIVNTINNQTTNSTRSDSTTPFMFVNGVFEGRIASDTEIVIPSAEAYDVLGTVGDITVTVKDPDNNVILKASAKTENKLTVHSLGDYTVEYSVTDSNKKTKTVKEFFSVYDACKPTLTFTSELQIRALAGTTLKLPTYTVSDNDDVANVKVFVTVMKPNGQMDSVSDDKYTFDQKGWYTVCYYAYDANNNCAFYTFNIQIV